MMKGPRKKVVKWLKVHYPRLRERNPQRDRGWGVALLECGHEISGPYTGYRYDTPRKTVMCYLCNRERLKEQKEAGK